MKGHENQMFGICAMIKNDNLQVPVMLQYLSDLNPLHIHSNPSCGLEVYSDAEFKYSSESGYLVCILKMDISP